MKFMVGKNETRFFLKKKLSLFVNAKTKLYRSLNFEDQGVL